MNRKNKLFRKSIACFLTILMTLMLGPLSSYVGVDLKSFISMASTDENIMNSGTCGNDVLWAYNSETKTLTISGVGPMNSFSYFEDDNSNFITTAPWKHLKNEIINIVIEDGVTSLGNYSFMGMSSVKTVSLSKNLKTIGHSSFSGCVSLSSIVIPNGVTKIQGSTFYECKNLCSVQLGDNTTEILGYSFGKCSSLCNIIIPSSVKKIDTGAFFNCSELKNITIPTAVNSIGTHAFWGCSNLEKIEILSKTVTISDSIISDNTMIWCYKGSTAEQYAYNKSFGYILLDCSEEENTISNSFLNIVWTINKITGVLNIEGDGEIQPISDYYDESWKEHRVYVKKIVFSDKITSFPAYSFSYCRNLTEVELPLALNEFTPLAFSYCKKLSTLIVPENNTCFASEDGILYNKNKTEILMYPCGKTDKSFTVKNSVEIIGKHCFYGCTSLNNINMSDAVLKIQQCAFSGCSNLVSVELSNRLYEIDDYVFNGCNSLSAIIIPNSVTKIGDYAFELCTSITDIYIPDSVISIGRSVFEFCYNLVQVQLGNSIQSISTLMFGDCESLSSIILPDTIEVIDCSAFSGCINLKKIILPKNLKVINSYAFYGCEKLTEINIPTNVETIGAGAFYGCKSLKAVVIPNSVKDIGYMTFFECEEIEKIYIYNPKCAIGSNAIPKYTIIYGYEDSSAYEYAEFKECYFGNIVNYHTCDFDNACDALCDLCGKTRQVFHDFTIKIIKESTCGETGIGESICKVCDYSEYNIIDKLPHNYAETVRENEITATCLNGGSYDEVCYCLVCDAELSRVTKKIEKLGHSFTNYVSNNDATCTADGTKTAKCDRCDATDTMTDVGSVKGHTEEIIPAVAATCTETGLTEGKKCSVCGKITVVQTEIKALGHSFTNYVSNNDATCTADGTKTAKCDRCDATDTIADAGSAKGHTEEIIPAVAATCTKTGLTQGKHCSVCNTVLVAQAEVPATGHTSDKGTVTKKATCTEDGVKTYKCTVCGKEMSTETIAALGHTEVIDEAVSATCTQSGKTAGKHCSVCNMVLVAQTEVAAKGHTSDKGTVTKEATCTEDGVKTFKCTVCGKEMSTETIAALGHTEVIDEAVPATCTQSGKTAGKHCSVCNMVLVAQAEMAATGHTSDKGTVTKKATCTTAGTKSFKCTVCGKVLKTETVKATGHTEVVLKARAATAKKSGLTEGKKCSACGKILTAQKMTLAQVTGLKASTVKTDSLKLTWTKIAGAKYYKVEQSTDGKTWKAIKTVDTNSYTVSKLTAGTKYQFRVTALDSTKKISSKASATLKTGTLTAAPTVTVKSTKSKTAVASWKKVTGASKYIVYKSTDGKKWTKVTTTTKLTYTLTKLTGGKKIYVKVVAVNAYGKNSAASKVVNTTVKK